MSTSSAARYAVYFAPDADSALWRFGSAVLGYDGAAGKDVPQLVPQGFGDDEFFALTEDPRHYAFHATIRSPFRLAEGVDEGRLVEVLEAFCASRTAFSMPALALTVIPARAGGEAFLALTEAAPSQELAALERAVVPAFEGCRAPLNEAERAKRRPDNLPERQLRYLDTYGYPYIFEDFRFHMTLTGRVPADRVPAMQAGLEALYRSHVDDALVPVNALALYRQLPGERFRILARASLNA